MKFQIGEVLRSPRTWAGLLLVITAYLCQAPVELACIHGLARGFGVHRSAPNILDPSSYGMAMSVRLLWDLGLWLALCVALKRKPWGIPIVYRAGVRYCILGLLTGLFVMALAISIIWSMGGAAISAAGQTIFTCLKSGGTWLGLDFIGALGEEIYGRAIILVLAERLLGWKGAILCSGLIFSALHLNNPGATWLWLLRIVLQGAVLAYAVYVTGSIWWSVGYHTGWNWVIAPLFGAAGSGYQDQGHLLTFAPRGSVWLQGGSVGPEGSVPALCAVLIAFCLLHVSLRHRFIRPLGSMPSC